MTPQRASIWCCATIVIAIVGIGCASVFLLLMFTPKPVSKPLTNEQLIRMFKLRQDAYSIVLDCPCDRVSWPVSIPLSESKQGSDILSHLLPIRESYPGKLSTVTYEVFPPRGRSSEVFRISVVDDELFFEFSGNIYVGGDKDQFARAVADLCRRYCDPKLKE